MFTKFLSDFAGGLFGDTGYLKDYKHAARLYQDNYYGMSPKAGWSYFVEIGLNPSLPNKSLFPEVNADWYNRSKGKLGLLAKTVDLPRISISNEILNSYNKKTVIQNKVSYNPISITFHDDMNNFINNLWSNYYQYYVADSRYTGTLAGSVYGRTLELPASFKQNAQWDNRAFAYGLNNGQDLPFLSFVRIFLLNRKQYTSVTLVNPKIVDYQPSQLDQNNGTKLMDAKFTFAYETVHYNNNHLAKGNKVTKSNPGFNQEHYDNSPSPLSIYGKGKKGLLGMVDGASDIFETLSSPELSVGDIIKVAVGTKNLVENAKKITGASARNEIKSLLVGSLAGAAVGQGAAGEYAKDVMRSPVDIKLFNESLPLNTVDANGVSRPTSYDASGNIVDYQGRVLTPARQSTKK